MSGPKLSNLRADEAERIVQLYVERGLSVRRIAALTGRAVGTVHNVLNGRGGKRSLGGKSTVVRERGTDVGTVDAKFEERRDGTADVTAFHPTPVRTIDEAVRVAGVDLSVWYVDKWDCTQWTVGIKLKHADGDEVRREQQYRVHLSLRRLAPKPILDALDAVYARIAKHAIRPQAPPKPRTPRSAETYLGVIGLFDAHFGKLAWGPETGEHYDLRIAETVYRNAVDDLITESTGRAVERWLLPIGNDHFHMDNARNTTFNGTSQDVDGRYAKVIEAGEMAVIWAVDRLLQVAPVDVVWIPGNHDPTTSYHMARTVAAWFQKSPRVAVDYGPSPRKYVKWHKTLIGLTHGNEEKVETLPSLMAAERAADWAQCPCREWLLGHVHRSRQWVTKPVDTFEGTTVRTLRSLAGTDAWHHRKGYVAGGGAGARAAEVYWYGKTRGYAGHAVAQARS